MVYVVCEDAGGAEFAGHDGENACTGACVDDVLAVYVFLYLEELAQDHAGGLVTACAEGLAWVDDDVVACAGDCGVAGVVDDDVWAKVYGSEAFLLPLLVPVLVGGFLEGVGDMGVWEGVVGDEGVKALAVE